MRYTASCRMDDLTPQILLALIIADEVYKAHGVEMWITSINDSGHMKGSLHYKGRAVDLRVRNIPAEHRFKIPKILKSRLSPGYDVIDEGDHIHIEWDPK